MTASPADEQPVRVLAISGSLRAVSSNSALVRTVAALSDGVADVSIYGGLADLPPFNPDLDGEAPVPAVADFRSALAASEAVLISSPEYAHGVPGVLKNALDWIVGSGELIDKPVALINVSPHATHAQASLAETLTVMSAKLIREASITVPLGGRKLEPHGIIADEGVRAALRTAIAALVTAARGAVGQHGQAHSR